jgi:hypothetical protein
VFACFDPIDVAQSQSRYEHDRDILEPRVSADHSRKFEAVEIGHHDVGQDDRDVILQKVFQSLARRLRPDQVFPEFTQDHLVGQKLRWLLEGRPC